MAEGRTVQYFVCFAVSIAAVTAGVSLSWSAPVIPKFHNNETSFNITEEQISWMAAISSPGYMAGSLLARSTLDRLGRRATILASAFPFIIGTVIILNSSTAWLLYATRFLWGMGTGMVTTVSPIYLAEIADKEIRGTLSAANRFMMQLGYLLVMSVGPFVSYQTLSYMLLVLPICYLIASLFIPETPYYLLKVGKVDGARVALTKLSGVKDEMVLEDQLSIMHGDVRQEMLRSGSIKELFTGKQYRKALIIVIGIRVTQILSGSVAIQQYLGRIIQESHTNIKVSTVLIISGALKFIAAVMSSTIVDRFGRRPLFLYSYFPTGLALFLVGAYFLILPTSPSIYGFIPFTGIIISSVVMTLGFDTVGYFIPAEYFPINVVSIAMTFLNIMGGFLNFLAVKGYQQMKDLSGITGVFWFYAISCFVGGVFTYFMVPETKGKSLREIQIELQGNIYDDASEKLNQIATKGTIELKGLEKRASD